MFKVYRISSHGGIIKGSAQINLDWTGIDILGPKSCIQANYNEPFDFEPEFPKMELDKNAIPTDLLSVRNLSEYLIVSERFLDVIKEYNTGTYQVFQRDLNTPKGNIPYFILYFPYWQDDTIVDWSASKFQFSPKDQRPDFWAKSENSEAYLKILEQIQSIQSRHLVSKLSEPPFDLFRMRAIREFSCHYISENMRQVFEDNCLTGINFLKETEFFTPEETETS
ncbi:MAG: hypothetical protein J0L99_05345 [Chitinophagales bacterium]|nr:hypothetical protein [Chitinophagales bacterium]